MEEKKLQLYQQILISSEQIRKEIMSNVSDILLFGGQISEEDNRELGAIAKITGDTFQALIEKGVESYDVPNKKDFIAISINGNEYLCHTSVIPSFQKKNSFIENTIKEEPKQVVENKYEQEKFSNTLENASNSTETPISNERIQTVEIPTEMPSNVVETITDVKEELFTQDNKTEFPVYVEQPEPIISEVTETQNVVLEETKEEFSEETSLEKTEEESLVEKDTELESQILVEYVKVQEEADTVEVPSIVEEKEEITTFNTETHISQFSRNTMFIEEKRKDFNEFIFDTYRITAMHSFGGRPEEMQIMIAPLKIQKYACTTVPILVSIYYKGRTYTKSSYDIQEEGKNLVQIDVNEYYFLCRGSFDDDGNFNSIILTTGPSANQGDKINILSRKKYGNSKRPNTNNGHIKFRYTADEGPGTIEVFPLEVGTQDFVIITKNDEFIDYLAISPTGYNKPFIYEDGVKKEILCNWDEDTLEVELLEA